MSEPTVSDPAIGIWKLNPDKSAFVLGPEPRSCVIKIERWEDGFKVSTDTIDALGRKFHMEAAYKFDGYDYPISGSPIADTISARRITECRTETLWRKEGKTVLKERTLTSSDDMTLRLIRTGVGALGRMADELLVYDKATESQPSGGDGDLTMPRTLGAV